MLEFRIFNMLYNKIHMFIMNQIIVLYTLPPSTGRVSTCDCAKVINLWLYV
jgi:hypothetical protein